MSSIARWSYVTPVTVYPFLGTDDFTRETLWGEPYTIMADFEAGGAELKNDEEGREFVCRSRIWCEDPRPKFRDEVEMAGTAGRETIRAVKRWPMGAFGEPDSPDFELSTG